MGKSMNLNNLTPEEAQKILQVIQKDFELRQKEKERLGKIEEVVCEEETKAELLTKQRHFNENCCIRCCQSFGFIFNRKTTCHTCRLHVCKSCCIYDDTKKAYNCTACLTQGELKQKSCDWFYDHVSARFKRFGSAKVVRTLYKQADSSRSKFHSDNESDSGYDPSLYSSFGQSGSIRAVKSRPSLQSVFPDIHISDEEGQELDNGLIPPPLMAPSLSPTAHTTTQYDSPNTSLENGQMSPRSPRPTPAPRMLTTPTQTMDDTLDNNKNVEKKDIYKEAFENSKRTEEAKFKIRFDNLVTDMQQSFENISPRDGRVPSGYGTTSYGDLMTTYKQRVRDMLVSLSQRLELAVESFDETCAHSPALTSQKVRQIISKLVEDRLGETLELTSDEAVSDLSSLSDDSSDQKSYEEQIAQAVIGRVLELHRNQTGVTLNLGEPMDLRQSDSSGTGAEEKLVNKTMDSSVGDDSVIDTMDKGISTGRSTVDTGVETEEARDKTKPKAAMVSTGVETEDTDGDYISTKRSNRTPEKYGTKTKRPRKGTYRLSDSTDERENDGEDEHEDESDDAFDGGERRHKNDSDEDDDDNDDNDDVDGGGRSHKKGDVVKARRSGKLEKNNNQRTKHEKDRNLYSNRHVEEDKVDGDTESGDNSVSDEDEHNIEEKPRGKHKTKSRARYLTEGESPKTKSKDSNRRSNSESDRRAQGDKSNSKQRTRSETDNCEHADETEAVDEKVLLQQEFERLRTFARERQPRPLFERKVEEEVEPEEIEDEIEAVTVDHDSSQEEFASKMFTFDKVHDQDSRFMPDFSDLDYEYHDLGIDEVDPDLLSMNLCPILEETEEELEDDKQDETKYEQDWKGNWIFHGADGINPYSSLTSIKNKKADFGDVSIMVPQPNEDWSPQVGNENVDDVSDLSENEDIDGLSDEENSFYAKTSEEIARITRKTTSSERATLFNTSAPTESASETDSTSSRPHSSSFSDSGPAKTNHYEGSSFDSRVSEKSPAKLSEDLVPSETGDPKFEIPPMSVTVPEGEPAKLTCRVSGTKPMDVFWYKVRNDELEELENSENFEIVRDGSRHHLTVYNMTSEDAGQFMCMVMNEKGRCLQYFILTTKKNTQELKAPEFLKKLVDVEVTEGQSVKFRCKVKGYPQPRVIWYKDGRILLNELNYKFERFGNRDYILAIETATMDEDAEYSVLARNIAGEGRSSAQLIVEPKNKPESVSIPKSKVALDTKSEEKEAEKAEKSGLIDLSYLRMGRSSGSSAGRTAKLTSDRKQEQNLTNLGKKMTMTRDSVTEVAEDMLATTKELTEIDKSIAAMDKLLEDLESDVGSVSSDLDLDPSNDLTCVATLDNYVVLQKAAENVRTVTSTALDYLNKTDSVAKGRQPSDDFATSTPRSSESERPFNPENDTSHIPCDSEVTMETTKTDVPMETLDISEDSHKSEAVFSVTPLTINMDTTKDASQKSMSSRLRASSDSKKSESEDKHLADTIAPSQSEDWFDVSDIQNTSNASTDSVSPSSPRSEPIRVNLGPKRENKAPFERDYFITNTPQMTRKTPPTSPREEQQRAHTEEKIYLAASTVYGLENKVQTLQDKMRAVHNVQQQEKLENQVAKTVAQVARSESQVKDIEKSVGQLKKAQGTSEPQRVTSAKTKQAPKAPVQVAALPVEKPEPTFLKGSTSEQDLPESRTEFNDEYGEIELPSVNRLKAMFGSTGGAKSDSSVRRVPDYSVHSITARSVPKGQLKKLKDTAEDDPHSRVAFKPAEPPAQPGRATSLTTGQKVKQTPNAPKQVYQSSNSNSVDSVEKSHHIPSQSIQISSKVKSSDSSSNSHAKSKQTVQILLATDTTNRPVSPVQSGTPTQNNRPIKSAASAKQPQTPVQSEAARQGGRTGSEIDTPEERKSPKIKQGAISAMSSFWEKINKGEAEKAPEILEYE